MTFNISYSKAGLPYETILADDFAVHPEQYQDLRDNNNPTTPFFFRRVIDFIQYCKNNGKLITGCTAPKPGDAVFMAPIT